ncbi:hypothetical protein [Clostridium haemolyticum]|nr:hypothetical protein [Clostridium haemolyticum]
MLKIYKTIQEAVKYNKDTKCFNLYIQDANIRVELFVNCLKITDLTNALKRGKECKQITVTYSELTSEDFYIELQNKYLNPSKKDLEDLINEIKNLKIFDLQDVGFNVELRFLKSIDIFSPFADIKPIKLPKNGKWTKSHVIKAILSGQIYEGKINGIYTNDYAHDNAVHCHKNENVDLMGIAQKLTESSGGWAVRFKEEKNDNIALNVDCCTFNCNTLYFNIDSRKDNIEYVENQIEDIQDQTAVIDNVITSTIEKTNIDTNSKVVNLFAYKQQKQENKQQLFKNLLSCNSLDQFKNIIENYLKYTKKKHIYIEDSLTNTKLLDKLEMLCKGNLVKMIECIDIVGYFMINEDIQEKKLHDDQN